MKNFKLSFTDNTTYTGKDLEGFNSAALLKGVTKEELRLIPNVKSKVKVAKLDLGAIIQDGDCSFSNTGEGTLSQKSMEAYDASVELEWCAQTFEQNYLSELMRAGSNSDQVMPENIEAYLLDQVGKKVSNDIEYILWQGSGATVSSNFSSEQGLQAKLAADGDVVDVSATTLTKANIIAQINRVYDEIPAEIKDSPELRIFMNTKTAGLYRQALADASNEMYYMQDHSELSFLGIKIVVAGGMGDDKMVAAERTNLVYLVDLFDDDQEVTILPMRNVTGARVVRFRTDFKIGVDFVYGAEIVYYA